MLIALLIMMSLVAAGLTFCAGFLFADMDAKSIFLGLIALVLWCTLLPMWYFAA